MNDFLEIFKKYKIFVLFIAAGIALILFSDMNFSSELKNDTQYSELEQKIANVIAENYNIKNCEVIITYDSNGEKILNNKAEEGVIFGGQPFVKSERLPFARGVLICAGGIDDATSGAIVDAVSVLLGINSSKIAIIN